MTGINRVKKKRSADSARSGNAVAATGVKVLKAEDAMNIGVKNTLQAILFNMVLDKGVFYYYTNSTK